MTHPVEPEIKGTREPKIQANTTWLRLATALYVAAAVPQNFNSQVQ
jgi:hypothetical protein